MLWGEIPRYLVDPRILDGVVLTLELTFGAMAFGIAAGGGIAAMATSRNLVLKAAAAAFVWWFRGCRCWCRCSSGTISRSSCR